jgi:hypothetical protein
MYRTFESARKIPPRARESSSEGILDLQEDVSNAMEHTSNVFLLMLIYEISSGEECLNLFSEIPRIILEIPIIDKIL